MAKKQKSTKSATKEPADLKKEKDLSKVEMTRAVAGMKLTRASSY